MKKKGQITFQNLAAIVLLLVIAGMIATFAADVTDNIQDNFVSDEGNLNCVVDGAQHNCTSAEFNASENTIIAITNLTGQFGNAGTVIGAGLIIGVLLTAFAVSRAGGIQFQ